MNIEDVKSDESQVEDVMKKVFKRQLELMEKYKDIEKLPQWPLNIDLFQHQVVIKDFKQRGLEEIAEAVEAYREENMNHFYEELIDALHFFTELNLLVGRGHDFFENINELAKDDAKFTDVKELYMAFGILAEKYGLLMNCLKNKPWKQSQVQTDKNKFYSLLKESFETFIMFLVAAGLKPDDIYNYYFRKSEVNQFRIRSKY
jgi:hypothetical protein